MDGLKGKTVVITGGTRGLGLAIAQAFTAEGAAVVVASRSQKSVDEALSGLRSQGAQAVGMAMNVGELTQVAALKDLALSSFGRLDVWVNNAGVAGPYGPTLENTPQDFQQVVQTNILGVYHGSRTAMRHFITQRSGKLINLLGHGYKGPVAWQNAYASSKAWVRSFTLALAEETKESGVGVYAYNPGMVLTELLTHVDVVAGSEEKLMRFPTILRMWARPPQQPAQKAVWIASSATDGKTGLLVNNMSTGSMLGGALREGVRALLRRPGHELDVQIRSVPRSQD